MDYIDDEENLSSLIGQTTKLLTNGRGVFLLLELVNSVQKFKSYQSKLGFIGIRLYHFYAMLKLSLKSRIRSHIDGLLLLDKCVNS